MPWRGASDYDKKHAALLARIDQLDESGYSVSLVAASAGASAALNGYIERRDKLRKVVLICGKINRPDSVGEQVYRRNEAFRPAMKRLQETVALLTVDDKAKILSLFSPIDTVVPYLDSNIDAVVERRLWSLNHAVSILTAISLQFSCPAKWLRIK